MNSTALKSPENPTTSEKNTTLQSDNFQKNAPLQSGNPHKSTQDNWLNEVWGGLAAMLVALPSSIAFGILVYANIGPSYSGQGAMAGLIGACALGLVTPFIGRTRGLISAPCGPSAAVLSALVISMSATSIVPSASSSLVAGVTSGGATAAESILVMLALVSLISALIQILFASLGGGQLIKFIPYQVVSGYLSGVALLIGLSQLPKLFGFSKGISIWNGLLTPQLWSAPSLIVGLITIIFTVAAPRLSKKIPAPIFGLVSGIMTYFTLTLFYPELLNVEANPLIIGPLKAQGSFFSGIGNQLSLFMSIDFNIVKNALIPALTLSTLLSIDTLKTCVAIDSLTRNRHNSNRELIGQGLGNLFCAFLGGLPGAGTMGATLVNLTSGGRTPLAGIFEGVFVLLALLFLGTFLAWIPVAALAGILLVVAFRMFDRGIFRLALTPAGRFDFLVIISVITVALSFDLIAASGVGIGMAILLFIRDQIRETIILQKTSLNFMSSKTQRQENEKEILQKFGHQAVICKLQGNLFFGTTDQFSRSLENELKGALYLLLDMRRVHSLDYTAFHLLQQVHLQLAERNGKLLFSGMPSQLYEKRNFEGYLSQMGLVNQSKDVLIFETFDGALEWMEEKILNQYGINHYKEEKPLELKDFYLFRGFTPLEFKYLEHCIDERLVSKGTKIVQHGDFGDELFLVRKGSFRALLPLVSGKNHHIATFEQGSFFGELAFLDRDRRSADIEAKVDAEVFIFSRSRFNQQSISAPEVGAQVFARLALAIAQRLRNTDLELRALEDR